MSTEKEYYELRKVLQDNVKAKGYTLETFLKTLEEEVTKYSQRLMEEAQDNESRYDAVSDQMAESLADLRKARENVETAIFFMVKAFHHGNPMDLITLEAE